MTYLERLDAIATEDVAGLRVKDAEYGGSWLRRGGVGAFMMLARKWDRLEAQVKQHDYDVFTAAEVDQRPEGVIDDIRDLRCYLLLVEAELRDRASKTQLESVIDMTEPEAP